MSQNASLDQWITDTDDDDDADDTPGDEDVVTGRVSAAETIAATLTPERVPYYVDDTGRITPCPGGHAPDRQLSSPCQFIDPGYRRHATGDLGALERRALTAAYLREEIVLADQPTTPRSRNDGRRA